MAGDVDFELTRPVPVSQEIKEKLAAEVKDLKKILIIESAAAETYKLVIKKFPNYEGLNDLKNILTDHKKAAEFWKMQLRVKDIHVKDPAAPWSELTLQRLKEGEEHGLAEYEELLMNNKVNFQSHSFIRNIGLDQQRKHIAMLEGLPEIL